MKIKNLKLKIIRQIKQTKIQLAIIAFLTFLSYSNIFQNEFVIDDRTFFLEWEMLQDLGNLPKLFTAEGLPANTSHIGYRPVRTSLMAFAYQFFGEHPFGYHLLSILIHLANTLFFYLIVKNISKLRFLPFITALLFALHPIHTEAVTFITASFDSMGITFLLGSFLLYLKYTLKKSTIFLFFSIFFSTLAFFTYEATLILPFLIITYDLLFRKKELSKFLSKTSLIYLGYFVPLLIYLYVRLFLVHITTRNSALGDNGYFTFLVMIKAFIKYIYLLIFPLNLSLEPRVEGGIYAHIERADLNRILANQSFFDVNNLFYLLVIVSLIFLVFRFYRSLPLISFSLTWFFLTFLPFANILQTGVIMQERYIYLASFAFCLMLAWLFITFLNRYKKNKLINTFLLIVLTTMLLSYVWKVHARNKDWRDDIALNKSISDSSPYNYLQHYNLGVRYSQKGLYNEASRAYLKSISANPNFWAAHFNLGNTYTTLGFKEKAIEEYKKAFELNPTYQPAKERLESLYRNENSKEE
ncbi:tetratricopeptide repeat protein [Candidatus Daviesbacteria bacterium]|nr:tetratricopeptide repeat protein [Candidatus Daviesbacteria bacterium]